MGLSALLAYPTTRGLDLDDPRTTELRRRIIQEKPFLRRIYQDWYATVAAALPPGSGRVLELGSGAGFLAASLPGLVTSEIQVLPHVRLVLDALDLPVATGSLRGIVMTNVLHHLSRPRRFLAEAARCVRPGGVVAMVEPWVTPWSRVVYRHLHHEPFDPGAESWEFTSSGPLSGANGALPWIIFQRDREAFGREFPVWRIRSISPAMPFCYLLAGGVSRMGFMPGWSYRAWRALEQWLPGLVRHGAMFATIVLDRQ